MVEFVIFSQAVSWKEKPKALGKNSTEKFWDSEFEKSEYFAHCSFIPGFIKRLTRHRKTTIKLFSTFILF